MLDRILYLIKSFLPKKLYTALGPVYHFFLGFLGNLLYGNPSNKLIVVGVTGTTGKTTSVFLIAAVLQAAGYKVGYTSTAMFSDGSSEWLNNKKMTMLGRWFTFRLLRRMVKNQCHYAIVETSSEGILQYRHRFINYDVLVFTGLYPEHLEAHGSFANYKETKGMLFAHLRDCRTKYVNNERRVVKPENELKKLRLNRVKKTIIVNGDDDNSDYFLNFWAEEKIKYRLSQNEEASPKLHKNYRKVIASRLKLTAVGTNFVIDNEPINLQLLGGFNAQNALNAWCVGLSQDFPIEAIKSGLESVKGVPGRLEQISQDQDFTVIVDYAFEPQAVTKLYETIKVLPHQKIIQVLGSAGGGRDAARRPILGKVAGEQADYVVVTNEDPYDDDPQLIIDQVAIGAEKAGKKNNETLFSVLDRREAIAKALSLARANDLVLITGKGSEQAICGSKGRKFAWDDREVTREELDRIIKHTESRGAK